MASTSEAELGLIVRNLMQFVTHNFDLMRLNRKVLSLCHDLERSRSFIKALAETQTNEEVLQSIVSDIREVARQAEDAIETCLVYELNQKTRSWLRRVLHVAEFNFKLQSLDKQMEDVSEKVKDIYRNNGQLVLQGRKDGETSVRREKKPVVVEEDNVVGCEDQVERIVDLVTGGSEELEVISVTGMFGLGKTTQAKRVFRDPRIEYEFQIRIFVNVSQEYKRKEVFLNLLRVFAEVTDQMLRMSETELAGLIQNYLAKYNFFIVMDDIWTEEAWDDLKVVFPNSRRRSRVLITTENKSVAIYANVRRNPHDLRFLSQKESQELLRRKVFGENSCRMELLESEARILEKCDGLPLAIVVVAGILLKHRQEVHWWRKVADDVNKFIAKEGSQSKQMIKISFNQLPRHLKLCFLYLGVFREDFEIPVWILLRLWIAEGLVEKVEYMCLEDVATEYLEELVNRNLVMVARRRSDGTIKTCRIHDTLLDFCKDEGRKENLFQELNRSNLASFLSDHPSSENCRRICVHSSVIEFFKSIPEAKRVRSLLSFAKEDIICPLEHISSIPRAFKLLRVLDVRPLKLTRFPAELYYLILLRYIAMSCDFKILPESLSNLRNLQTIIIQTTSRTLEIRADISKMTLLRHLHSNKSTRLRKVKGESSANEDLQTLSTISPESCTKELFEKTPNLKKLGIRGKLAAILEGNTQPDLFECLVKLEYLENLKLLNDDSTCKLHTLPQEHNFPSTLTRLTLLNTFLEWKHTSVLGKLPNLTVLKLKDNAFEGELWETEDGGFPKLKVLHIGATNLASWRASEDHFPSLTSLFLRHCTKLAALPHGLAGMPCLHTIDLHCTNSRLASIARKIQVLRLEMGDEFKLSVYPPDQ